MQTAPPISIVWVIADHPWHGPVSQAQVRIAMAVGRVGNENGVLVNVNKEGALTKAAAGKINPNLTIGVDVSTAKPLKANEGLEQITFETLHVSKGAFRKQTWFFPESTPLRGAPHRVRR